MLLLVIRRYQDVIEVGIAEVQSTEYLLDETLKSLGRIVQFKAYERKYEKPERRSWSRLGDVLFDDLDLSVNSDEVGLGKDLAPKRLCEILDVGDV